MTCDYEDDYIKAIKLLDEALDKLADAYRLIDGMDEEAYLEEAERQISYCIGSLLHRLYNCGVIKLVESKPEKS